MMAVVRKHSWNSNLMLEFFNTIIGDGMLDTVAILQVQSIMVMILPLLLQLPAEQVIMMAPHLLKSLLD